MVMVTWDPPHNDSFANFRWLHRFRENPNYPFTCLHAAGTYVGSCHFSKAAQTSNPHADNWRYEFHEQGGLALLTETFFHVWSRIKERSVKWDTYPVAPNMEDAVDFLETPPKKKKKQAMTLNQRKYRSSWHQGFSPASWSSLRNLESKSRGSLKVKVSISHYSNLAPFDAHTSTMTYTSIFSSLQLAFQNNSLLILWL